MQIFGVSNSQDRVQVLQGEPDIPNGFGIETIIKVKWKNFMFDFPCIVSLYYIRNEQDAALAVSFISHCNITLNVSDAFCVHHQEY